MKKIIGALSLILIVSALIIGCKGGKISTPKNTVNEYYSFLKSGKVEKALSLTTMSDEEIKKEVAKYEGFKFDLKDYEILSEEIVEDGKTATVKVKYSFTSTMSDKTENKEDKIKLLQSVQV